LGYIDHFKEKRPRPGALSGKMLADQLGVGHSNVAGSQVNEVVEQAVQYGADEVLVADDPT
jgi:hypothetical protein